MLKQQTKRLRDRTVVTAAILSLMGSNTYAFDNGPMGGPHNNDRRTTSPIKHVIVIMGENRTFDHVFATYQAAQRRARRQSAVQGNRQQGRIARPELRQGGAVLGGGQQLLLASAPVARHRTTIRPTRLQTPGTSYAPQTCYTTSNAAALNGPGCLATLALAAQADYGLRPQDLPLLTTGATGIPGNSPDTRILNCHQPAERPLSAGASRSRERSPPASTLLTAAARCIASTRCGSNSTATPQRYPRQNPSGCQADLFPWVEQTVSSGSQRQSAAEPAPTPLLKEGDIAMGFYNVAKGDAPYLTQLAREYTLNDNYHQPVMGGTFANQMMFGYADALYYADANGDPATPNQVLVPGSNPPVMSMRSRTPIRRRAPTTGTPMTDMAAAATPTAPTIASRAWPRSSII